jgi:hypothetical protein
VGITGFEPVTRGSSILRSTIGAIFPYVGMTRLELAYSASQMQGLAY